jgi:hypothetical protein
MMGRALLLLALTVLVSFSAACGGEDDGQSEEAAAALEDLERATGGSESVAEPTQQDLARLDSGDLVRRYFGLIEAGRFREAWGYVAPSLQVQFGGFESWKAGYGATVSNDVLEASPEGEDASGTDLEVRISAVDSCDGQSYAREFAGDWTVNKASQLILDADFAQVGGDSLPSGC